MVTIPEVLSFVEIQLEHTMKLEQGLSYQDNDRLILEGRRHAYKEIRAVLLGNWNIKKIY